MARIRIHYLWHLILKHYAKLCNTTWASLKERVVGDIKVAQIVYQYAEPSVRNAGVDMYPTYAYHFMYNLDKNVINRRVQQLQKCVFDDCTLRFWPNKARKYCLGCRDRPAITKKANQKKMNRKRRQGIVSTPCKVKLVKYED